jgi:hypothetical protein
VAGKVWQRPRKGWRGQGKVGETKIRGWIGDKKRLRKGHGGKTWDSQEEADERGQG